jgi:outer membrane protein OmpA-like peptidoglycan-associated protein
MRKTAWVLAGLIAVPCIARADYMAPNYTEDRGRYLDHATVASMGGVGNYLTQADIDAYYSRDHRRSSEAGISSDTSKIPEAVVYFDTGKDTLNKNGVTAVDKVARELKNNSSLIVQVDAYTDAKGDTSMNKKLSNDRARAVRDELLKNGVSSNQIHTKAFGAEQPIASNESEGGRAVNRRAELFVVS